MSEADQSEKKAVTLNLLGPLQLFIGLIVGQILFALTVSVPGYVGIAIAMATGVSDDYALFFVLAAGAIGVTICAAIGALLGRRHDVTWWFVVGATAICAWPLFTALIQPSTTVVALATAGTFVCAGAALVIGFQVGRTRRAASRGHRVAHPRGRPEQCRGADPAQRA